MIVEADQLHVIRCYDRLPPLPGGMERHIASLTAAQRRLGVRVTEVYHRGLPAGEAIQLWPGRAIDRLRPRALGNLLFYGAAIRRAAALAGSGVQVVHAHGDWSAALLAQRFARAAGARATAVSIHGSAIDRRQHLYAAALRGCAPIFATGLKEARLLTALAGKRVLHLPSASDEIFFTPAVAASPATDVIAVGSLTRNKNLELLLRCAALRPHLSFAIYGDGPDRARLERVRRREGLNNVTFHGAVPIERVQAAMNRARLFVSLSAAEGSPTAALEAMACRLPVLLTPSNDYSAIVEQGRNGRVTSGWDAAELVAGIDEFVADAARGRAAGEAGRTIAEGHRWDAKAKIVTDAMIAAVTARGF